MVKMAYDYDDLRDEVANIKQQLRDGWVGDNDINNFNQIAGNFVRGLDPNQEPFWKGQYGNALAYYQKLNLGGGLLKGKIKTHDPTNNVPTLNRTESAVFRDMANTSAQISLKSHENNLLAEYNIVKNKINGLASLSPTENAKVVDLIGKLHSDPNQHANLSLDPANKKYVDYAHDYLTAFQNIGTEQTFIYGQSRLSSINPVDFDQIKAFIKIDEQSLAHNSEQISELKKIAATNSAFVNYYNQANEATPNNIQTVNKKAVNKPPKKDANGNLVYDRYDKTWGASNFLEFKAFELKRLQYQEQGLQFNDTFTFKPTVDYVPDEINNNQKITAPNQQLLKYDDYKDKAALVAKEEMASAKATLALSVIGLKKSASFYQYLSPTDKTLFADVLQQVGDVANNKVKPLTEAEITQYGAQQEVVRSAIDVAYSIQGINQANQTIYGYNKTKRLAFNIDQIQDYVMYDGPFNISSPSMSVTDILTPKTSPTAPGPGGNTNTPNAPTGAPQPNHPLLPGTAPGTARSQAVAQRPSNNPGGLASLLVNFAGGVGYVAGASTSSLVKNFWEGITHPITFTPPKKTTPFENSLALGKANFDPIELSANEPFKNVLAIRHQPNSTFDEITHQLGNNKQITTSYIPNLPSLIGKGDIFESKAIKSEDPNNPFLLTVHNLLQKERQLGLREKGDNEKMHPMSRLVDIHNQIVTLTHILPSTDMQPEDKALAMNELSMRFQQFDNLLHDDKNGLVKKIDKQLKDSRHEIKTVGIANASLLNKITENIEKTVKFSEQNSLYDPKAFKFGKDRDKTPESVLDNAKAKISDIAQNIVDLFNRVRASFTNLLAPATPAAQANAPAAPSSPSP